MSAWSSQEPEPVLAVARDDVAILRERTRAAGSAPVAARRARIVLLSAQGLGTAAIAARVGCAKQTVITWRERYRRGGLPALGDAPRPGRPVSVDEAVVIARTIEGPAPALGLDRWSTRTLAAEVGISNGTIAAIWRAWGVRPAPRGVRLLTRPALELAGPALFGLVVEPPIRVLGVAAAPGAGHRPARGAAPEVPDLLSRLARLEPSTSSRRAGPVESVGPDGGARPAGRGEPAAVAAGPIRAMVRAGADRVVVADAHDVTGASIAGLPVHVAAPGTWERTVHALAVAAELGGHPVGDLIAALDEHLAAGGGPVRWIRRRPFNKSCIDSHHPIGNASRPGRA